MTQHPKRHFPTSETPKWSQLSKFPKYFPRWQIICRKEQTPTTANSEKFAIVPLKVRPDMTKPLLSVQPNTIEDDEGKFSTSFQHKVHMSPSGPNIVLPEFTVPPPRVQTAQPPRVDTEGPNSSLRSRGKKNPIPHFSLTSQCQKIHEANAVTHQISGVAEEYRHMAKVPDRKFWKDTLQMKWGS